MAAAVAMAMVATLVRAATGPDQQPAAGGGIAFDDQKAADQPDRGADALQFDDEAPEPAESAPLVGDDAFVKRLAFAGSAQRDYLYVEGQEPGRASTLDGFTTELSLKLAADFSEEVSFNVKTCYGCHGFELGMAYADIFSDFDDEHALHLGFVGSF